MSSPYFFFGVLVFLLTAGAPAENHLLRFLSKIGVSAADGWMGWMSFVAFSPDGTMVASDGPPTPDDTRGALTLWSFPEGRLIKTIPFRPEALSDDWKYCASDAGVIDMRTGEPLSSISGGTQGWTAVAFSSQSQYVAMERKVCKRPDCNRIRIAHPADGTVISEFGRRALFSLAFHPGGKLLASGHWDNVTLWNVESGQRIGLLRGFARYVTGIAFNHNGTILAAGTDLGGLQIWDVSTQNRLSSIDPKGGDVSIPAFSPDGQFVAAGVYGTGTVFVIDVPAGKLVDSARVSGLGCGSVAFSPDGRFLITPSTGGLITWPYDRAGTIRVFELHALTSAPK